MTLTATGNDGGYRPGAAAGAPTLGRWIVWTTFAVLVAVIGVTAWLPRRRSARV